MEQQRWIGKRYRALVTLAVGGLVLALFITVGVKPSGATFTRSSANPSNLFSAGAINLTNSKSGAAVLSATGLLPGGSVQGSLSVKITGNYGAAVTLTGASDHSALSQALTLQIEDTTGTAQTLWSGTMSDFSTLSLGTYTSGTTKSYRFTVTFPSANADSGLQNTSTSMTLRFSGVAQ
jgi:hypothetical protein